MKYKKIEDIKIYHQGVDTLKTSHVITFQNAYENYQGILELLEQAKGKAIDANSNYEFENGLTFEFLNLGNFKIMPKGQGRFKYVISNQDITIYFSTVKFGANDFNTPQLSVEFRAKFLTLLGHREAYKQVLSTLREMLGFPVDYSKDFIKTFCQRIDLASDVGGMEYVPSDKYRFQTNFKRNSYIEYLEHIQFNRLTGFTFGKGDYMLRIYDKRLELNRNASKLWLTTKWVDNGYCEMSRPSVWRHEIQLRRPYLKYFIPDNTRDEVLFLFDMLPELWTYAINKVTWVDLTVDEVGKIMDAEYSPDSLRQVFYRAKVNEKGDRLSFWNMLNMWDNQISSPAEKLDRFKETDYRVPKRFLKSFLSTAYKISDGNPRELISLLDAVQGDTLQYEGHTLHQYAQNKLLSSYIDNAYFVSNHGLVIEKDFSTLAINLYDELKEVFQNLDNKDFKRNAHRIEDIKRMQKISFEKELQDYDREN